MSRQRLVGGEDLLGDDVQRQSVRDFRPRSAGRFASSRAGRTAPQSACGSASGPGVDAARRRPAGNAAAGGGDTLRVVEAVGMVDRSPESLPSANISFRLFCTTAARALCAHDRHADCARLPRRRLRISLALATRTQPLGSRFCRRFVACGAGARYRARGHWRARMSRAAICGWLVGSADTVLDPHRRIARDRLCVARRDLLVMRTEGAFCATAHIG